MIETFTRKRVEILVDTPLAQRVIQAAADAGIAGYTLIPVQSGSGRSGTWRGDHVTGAQTKTIFLTIASRKTPPGWSMRSRRISAATACCSR
jgi:hypothetical protein